MAAETNGSGLVRVRVRPGARIKMATDHTAVGGDWIELPASELSIRAVRANVETEQEISARATARANPPPGPSQSDEHFNRLRNAARIQAEQAKASRDDVDRTLAEQTLIQAGKDEQQVKKKAR